MSVRSRLVSILLVTIFTVFLNLAASAQGTSGTVTGTVADPAGAAIPGATVSIANRPDTPGFVTSIVTDENGHFEFKEVPSGSYRLTVKSQYFCDYSANVEVYAESVSIVNPPLEIPHCYGNGSYLGLAGSALSRRTSSKKPFSERLPRKTTFGSLLKMVPNARPEVLAAGLQVDGNSGADNTYFIDGQEVTNFRSGLLNTNNDLPFELLREVQVTSDGISAQYSGATGAVVNVVTTGGNNGWHGNFGVSFTPGRFEGRPNQVLNRYGSNSGQIEYFQPRKDGGFGSFPTASIGGPIAKGKLWFFAAYSPQIYDTTRTIDYFSSGDPATRTTTETIKYKANVRTDEAFVRLDAQPFSNLRAFGTFLYNPIIQDGILPAFTEGLGGAPQAVGGLRGAGFLATRGGRQNSNIVNGQVTWDVSKNVLLNLRAGRGFLNEKLDSYGLPRTTRFLCSVSGSPETVPGSNCSRGFQNVSSNFVRDFEVSKRTTFDVESAVSGINLLGRHSFKFGYQFNRVFNEISEGYTDTGIVVLYYGLPITLLGIPVTPTPGNLGSGLLQRFGTVGESTGTNQALYAQDSWTIKNRLFLNVGIRFENESVPDYGGLRYDIPVLMQSPTFDFRFGWNEKIAPRVAAAFDVTGDGDTKIFGSYGWYYDRLKFNAFQELFPQIFYRDYFEILPSRGAAYSNYTLPNILGNNVDNPNGQCPIANSTGWSVCQFSFIIPSPIGPFFPPPPIDPDLKPARTSEFAFGVEQRLGGSLIISGRFIRRQLDRAVEDVGTFNDQGSEVYLLGNPGFGLHCTIASDANLPCSRAERNYDAFELIVDKRAANFFFSASYTYSRLFGNYSGLAGSDEFGRVSPNVLRNFDLPFVGFDADGNPDNGRLATDRPHVFKAYGGYSFDWFDDMTNRTSVSAFTTLQSGTPLTTVYSLYNVMTANLFGRGDLGRTESYSETDLMIGHRYKFGQDRKFSLEPYLVFLNLFDERNEITRQTSISSTNFTTTALTQGGCTTCTSQFAVINTIFNGGGISRFVQNYLNARGISSSGIRNDYNQPNLFQQPRYVRFGLRLSY